MMLLQALLSLVISITTLDSLVECYVPAPDLNREEIAGIWKLTSRKSFLPTIKEIKYPLKEFTVFGKKSKNKQKDQEYKKDEDGILLVISEDGSFHIANDEDSRDKSQKTVATRQQKSPLSGIIGTAADLKGTWEFLDGKLILAADRPADADGKRVHDTILVGSVFANKGKSLLSRPSTTPIDNMKKDEGQTSTKTTPTSQSPSDDVTTVTPESSSTRPSPSTRSSNHNSDNDAVDVHLSVPDGSVEIGRFMYPRRHPSFFEQPFFSPTSTGSFQLRQILGKLNTRRISEEKKITPAFHKADFYGKKFWLTSQPLRYKKKGPLKWNRELGRYVEDVPPPDPNETLDVRVMELIFFANNTFSTIPPPGGVKILRGRFRVIGEKRDHLWFQVQRFGFGRSVSGSVYSEGKGLTADDERAYWGMIKVVALEGGGDDRDDRDDALSNKIQGIVEDGGDSKTEVEGDNTPRKTMLEVKGTVLLGWGLEPQPVGKFTMKEIINSVDDDDDDEYDDEEDMEEGRDEKDRGDTLHNPFDDIEGAFE